MAEQAAQADRQPTEDPAAKAARLRAEADAIEAALPAPAGTVRLKVGPPHESFTVGGVTVGRALTPVPSHMSAVFFESAAAAGVALTQEGA